MRTAQKTIALALSASLAVLPLMGCGGPAKEEQAVQQTVADQTTEQQEAAKQGESQQEAASQDQSQETIAGGWTVSAEGTGSLTADEKAMFEKAAETSSYPLEPVQLLATQLVSGRNFAYLCRMTSPTSGATVWGVAVVYQDLEGNVRMSQVIPIDLTNIQTAQDSVAKDVEGGWEIEIPAQANALPGEAEQAFAAAVKEYKDAELMPIALLGTQVVAGTNYQVLCVSTKSDGSAPDLCVAQVYRDLDGNAQMSEVKTLDLLKYVSA
ncbi:MAG: hypothetical protein Q4A01_10845 [Coriobacteriales bacterium]|nr:hypothetical protein [Coriobacteriales bacterium]